jgi:hypothetical protein
MKKITLSTVKSFIKKTSNLHIDVQSVFDGMSDCVMPVSDTGFTPAHRIDRHLDNTLGIQGAWFVKGSRDYFSEYDDGEFKGFTVHNCCGSFILAKPVAEQHEAATNSN